VSHYKVTHPTGPGELWVNLEMKELEGPMECMSSFGTTPLRQLNSTTVRNSAVLK
jgi:hypothetical protein